MFNIKEKMFQKPEQYLKYRYAKTWIKRRESSLHDLNADDLKLASVLLHHIPVRSSLLDIGCGTGIFMHYFKMQSYNVVGVDHSPVMTEYCLTRGLLVITKNAEGLGFSDDTFDCVYCFNSTWQFQDLHKAISEMIRVSRRYVIFNILEPTLEVKLNHFKYNLMFWKPRYEKTTSVEQMKSILGNVKIINAAKKIIIYEKNN